MSLQVHALALALAASLVLLGCCCLADTTINTIRTVILQEEQDPLVNRGLWGPSLDVMVSVCV